MRTWVMRCEKSEEGDDGGGGAAAGRGGLLVVMLLLLASSSSSARSSKWLRLCESMATDGRRWRSRGAEGCGGCATKKKGGYGFGKSAEVQADVVTDRRFANVEQARRRKWAARVFFFLIYLLVCNKDANSTSNQRFGAKRPALAR